MRELFDAHGHSPLDPREASRKSSTTPLRKRFYETAGVAEVPEGFAVTLDGKQVRTPGKRLLAAPVRELAEAMAAAGKGQRFKRTLAGAVIERRAGRFLFYREAGREGLERVPLAPGSDFIWDGRFAIRADPALQSGLSVAALGEEGRRLAGPPPEGVPAGVIETLPAVWRGKRLRAVPILGFVMGRPLPISMHAAIAERMAQPPLFPGFFVSI